MLDNVYGNILMLYSLDTSFHTQIKSYKMALQLLNHFHEKGQVKHIILNINITVLIVYIFRSHFHFYNYVCCMKTWVNIHIDLNISTLETQIHSLPQGISLGANIAASPVKDVHKAAPHSYTLLYQAL